MILLLVALFLILGTNTSTGPPVLIEEPNLFPAQFFVHGVAEDDVLSIRSGPSEADPIIAQFGPHDRYIEVLELNTSRNWGLVGVGNGNGWVSLRFLARQNPVSQDVPRPVSCFGTEPFWSLELSSSESSFNTPDTGPESLTMLYESSDTSAYLAEFFDQGTNRMLLVKPGECSDGMSDRRFGLTAEISVSTPSENFSLQGCCTLDALNLR